MQYVSVKEARLRAGLRLVLTVGGPGPWSEAAKGFCYAKRLDFQPVAQVAGETDPELVDWTGQSSAPAAALDDEPPVSSISDILLLTERLAPEPALVPDDPGERAWMFGLLREISGREGLGWSRRLVMLHRNLERQKPGPGREQTRHFCAKYGYDAQLVGRAHARVIEILRLLSSQLGERGGRYFLGDRLSALDVAWAAFAAMLAPLPEELCPMHAGLRRMYTATEPDLLEALDPRLLAHRDQVYREHLRLPLDF